MPAFHRFRLAHTGFDPEALPAAEVSRCVAAGRRGRTGRRRLDSAAPRGGAQRDPLDRDCTGNLGMLGCTLGMYNRFPSTRG